MQTFFVSAISGGIFAELANLIDNPEDIIDLLAKSLPSQSSFFIQIVIATTCFLQPLEFLRIYPLGLAFLRRFFGPRLTAKERRTSWGWIKSLEDPPDFWHAETFAQLILYYIVFFVYATIAPITSFFLFVCFLILESGYRYQFIHNYPRSFDTGGRLWMHFIHFVLASMLISQFTLVGLLSLKKNKFAAPAMGPIIAMTILFTIYINSRHAKVTKFLPTYNSMKIDERDQKLLLDPNFAKGLYLQPALQHPTTEPDFNFD